MDQKIIMQLDELTCPSCLSTIETALQHTAGVGPTTVLFNASKVKAQFDSTITSADQITTTVTRLGYAVLSSKLKPLSGGQN